MTDSGPQPRSHRKRLLHLLVVAIVLVVVVVVAILMPRYRSYIATVDGAHLWSNETAPPRREVVWQPATPVIPETDPERSSHSHIRPQITDNGNTLYFTVRSAANDLDIVRCQRAGDGWSTPRKVSVLNSDAEDVGPVIRDDGQVLYLYSNRAGGFGGMDLYVSRRDGDLWSEPVNLGPMINSPAHEYDPAISPDSLRLFFSSNRSEQMHQQLVAGSDDLNRDHWSTTLRNDLGSRTFDLYAADLDPESNQWNQAAPLRWLNTRDHNEGAPFASPDGAFLVFASDRPTRPTAAKNGAAKDSAAKNFDLYRARIDRADVMPENLGPGVNTSANEIEPCLTSAGFQLLFSRSDPNNVSQYTLYQSTAKEIYRDRQWDLSNTQAFANWVRKIFDHLWLLLLTLAAIALLVWFLRQLTIRRVAVPGFLLAALLLHLFLVTSSFYVFFQQQITERLKKMFEEPVVATQILLDSAAPMTAEQTTLENVVSLAMPQPIQAIDVSRQSVEAPNELQPIELAKPQQIASNVSVVADLPSDPVVATVMIEDQPNEVSEVLHRAPAPRPRQTERVHLEQTVAVEVPQVESLPSKKTEIDRAERSPPHDLVEPIRLEVVDREPKPSVLEISALEISDLQPTETIPESESSPSTAALQRAPPTEPRLDPLEVDTPAPTETVSAVETPEMPSPTPRSVPLDRTNEMLAPAVDQPEPIRLARQNRSAPKPADREPLIPVVAETQTAGSVTSQPTTSPLKRSRLSTTVADHDSPVSTAAIGFRSKDPQRAPENPQANVEVARKHPEQPSINIIPLAISDERETMAPPPVSGERQDVDALLAKTDPLSDHRDPLASPLLPRRGSKQSRVYADASVNLQSLLMRRKLDEATKVEVVKQYGGNDQTLVAVRRGLSWIEQHQETDGHWGLNDFNKQCKGHKRCTGHGNSKSDTAGTALALLPFLGDGNTHKDGPYKDVVARGITWLVKNQKPDGNLFTGGQGNAMMYSQGIAAIALCECYGMTGDVSLRDPAQRAIDFIVAAQDPKSGGWRYQPRQFGDTSVVGWQVMALKSAQMADLNVPQKSLEESQRWLDSVAGKKNRLGQFAYQGGRFNPAMTAEAILCLEYLGIERASDSLVHGGDFLLKNLPKKGRETSYYWYYGTQSMFHFQGEHWQRWNDAIHPLLVDTQHKDGPLLGTWDPKDQWEKSGGRIYATSLRVLMLEVYYRHLPLYQVIR